jgi:hypothetical protein
MGFMFFLSGQQSAIGFTSHQYFLDAPLNIASSEKQKAVEAIRLRRWPQTIRRNTHQRA